jgi:site-specific recombinase XerD
MKKALIWWRKKYIPAPYQDATMLDIYRAREAMDADGYAISGNVHRLTALRLFLLWLIENGYSNLPKDKIAAIAIPNDNQTTVKAEDLLTEAEIEQLIRAAKYSRDRAIIAVLYESGMRIGELTRLTWGQVVHDQYGFALHTGSKFRRGKKVKPRYIRLIFSQEWLAAWKNDYKGDPTGESLVFPTIFGQMYRYQGIWTLIARTAQRSGLTKRVYPHLFRHSRVTNLLRQGVPESVIKLTIWGDIGSDMLRRYAHLVQADIDAAMLELHGIRNPKKEGEKRLKAVECPRCRFICSPISRYCAHCGMSLTEEAVASIDDMKRDVLSDPEALQALIDQRIQEALKKG